MCIRDSGPDPDWTPQILDILKAKNARAAFFVVGAQAERHPDLVRRMVDEGHEVGVHTYFHPDLSRVSSGRLELELNATQHLLEGLLQRSTVLFRPPYNVDSRPGLAEEVVPLLQAQKLGYVTVTQSIDTMDWDQPGVETILARVKAERATGNTLLMHDAGGDRSQTVEALPLIIDWLRARGDEVVPLATLIGVSAHDLMPSVTKEEDELIARTGFDVLRFLERFFWAFMIVATLLVLARTLAVLWLAVRHERRLARTPCAAPATPPPVSVLIAAYNEAKVIGATLRSILASQYAGEVEVVVVDDGSRDATATEVERIAATDARVRLVRQPNQGKAHALQNALAHASHPTLVMLDADTQFEARTIGELVRTLGQPGVGAVSGHVKVGNQRRWLGRFQSLEYTCGFNLDRRAYDELDCITVVPGAACAMRREALEQAGGFSADTLAEDTDLTLALHRAGWSVRYNPAAIAWTEAPETVGALARQRVRWSFGTLQGQWKHGDMLFNPQFGWLGLFSLPSIALFQMALVAMIPLVDALLVASLIWGFGLAIAHYAVIFLLVDLALALLACRMEREPLWCAAYIVPMRLLYRPLLAYAVWHSLLRALRGRWSGWSKLERRGNVLLGQPRGV
jgi:cellulose synthase/poly-beta-1,6-N-acetylglucosamine synthase-like glycosyltransferase/peptidoglycan/xylan/chitin deacetylase (PgdA/CDA1 family)